MTKVRPVDLHELLANADARRPRSQQTATARAGGKWGVGPSDVGRCRAAIGYRENPPPDFVPDPEDKTAAYVGTLLHDGVARLLRRKRSVQVEGEVWVPGLDVPGHFDLFEPRFKRLTDWKFPGDWAHDRVKESGPFLDDQQQVQMYALTLIEEGFEVDTVRLVYVRRGKPRDIAEFERPYDREVALAGLSRLHAIIEALDNGITLPRDRKGPNLDGICRGCFARSHCWNIPEAEYHGRTPEGWMVARDDDAIAEQLVRYLEAPLKLTAREAEAVKDEVKVIVEGYKEGRYGDATLRWTGGKTKWVDDEAERVAQLEDELRKARAENRLPGSPELLPVPQKQVTGVRRIEIKWVRADVLEAERAAAVGSGVDGG